MKGITVLLLFFAIALMPLAKNSAQEEATATATLTETWTATATWTATPSWTPTATWTATPTWTATWTPIVQTVVVTQPAPAPIVITQAPIVITAVPAVPTQPVATEAPRVTSLPPATLMTPFYGWRRYQSIHFIAVTGSWGIVNDASASARQYRSSSSARAIARYPFTGEGVRLAYLAHPQGCLFDIYIDNIWLANLDSWSEEADWRLTEPFFLTSGYHVFDLRSQAQVSGTCALSFDYIEVFSGPPIPNLSVANGLNNSVNVTESARDVAEVVLISAPATAIPSPSPIPPSIVVLNIQVAYDANASGTADLNEGVQGISVRVLNARTGELLNSGFTDERGSLRLQIVSSDELTLYIPFLGRSLNVRPARSGSSEQRWEVLIPAANQPAVIP
jgi:hypothetical protein